MQPGLRERNIRLLFGLEGSSSLQNLGDGYYQYNWKTPTTYTNSRKTLQLNLDEGSPRTATFQLTK